MSNLLDIDEITSNLKATIASNKGGVLLANIESDYINMNGKSIPYQKLGFKSLRQFILSLQSFKIENFETGLKVNVLSGEKTKHLEDMIKKQKSSRKPSKKRNTQQGKSTYNYYKSNFSGYSTNRENSRWGKNQDVKKKEVHYNSNLPRDTNLKKLNTSAYSMSSNNFNLKKSNNSMYSVDTIDTRQHQIWSNSSEVNDIRTNIKTIITNKGGVLLHKIQDEYMNFFDKPIPYQKFGNNSLLEFIQSLKSFKIESHGLDSKVYMLMHDEETEVIIKKQESPRRLPYNTNSSKNSNQTPYKNPYKNEVDFERGKNNDLTIKKNPSNNFNQSFNFWKNKVDSGWTKYNDVKKSEVNNTTSARNFNLENKNTNVNFKSTVNTKLQFNKKVQLKAKEEIGKSKVPAQDRLLRFTKKCISDIEPLNPFTMRPIPDFEKLNFKMKQLELENKSNQMITVTAVTSPSKIWIVLNDLKYNNDFLEMEMELENIKLCDQHLVENPIIGCLYALFNQEKWHRIVIECINLDHTFKCFFVDTGKSIDHANKNQIYTLKSKFLNIPAQAVEIVLSNLKSIDGFPLINEILIDVLLNKKCILNPDNVKMNPLTVTLYDINSMTNLNDLVLNIFIKKVTPKLIKMENDPYYFVKAKVLSIENGYLYLRLNNSIIDSLENLLSTDLFKEPVVQNIEDIISENVYLTSYKLNLKGRVKVIDSISTSLVKVYFIDYGTSNIIRVEELIDLHKIDITIAQLPCQAIQVILHMFPPEKMNHFVVIKLFEILNHKFDVSVFKIKDINEKIPCIDLVSDLYPSSFISKILYQRFQK